MRGGRLAAAMALAAMVACGTTNVTNITVVSDAGEEHDDSGVSTQPRDAGADVESDTSVDEDAGDDAGPTECTGGNPPSPKVSNDCYAANPCPFDFCGPTGFAYVCNGSGSTRPPIDGCRQSDNNLHCCLPQCVRSVEADPQCAGGEVGYSCPQNPLDGGSAIAIPTGCKPASPGKPGFGFRVCCDS